MAVKSTREWLDDGHTRADLRTELASGRLVRPRRGFVMDGGERQPVALHLKKVIATRHVLGASTLFSHISAAVIHELPLLNRRLAELTVVRAGGGHGGVSGTLHARSAAIAPDDATEVNGLPVTSLARTVADLVRTLPFPEAVMVADAALRKGADRDELLQRSASGRGCRMALRALEFADARSESAGESLSRVRIHSLGLPAPDLQRVLYDDRGQLIARVDFWWEEFQLAGEFDGMVKYGANLVPGQTPAAAIAREKQREQQIIAARKFVVRWGWENLWKPGLDVLIRNMMVPAQRRSA